MRGSDAGELVSWIIDRVAALTDRPSGSVSSTDRFRDLGITSLPLTSLLDELSVRLGRPVAATLAWSNPTPAGLARALSEDAPAVGPDPDTRAVRGAVRTPGEPLALVGMAGRFPGAPSVAALWELLLAGGDAIGDVPVDRWDGAAWSDARPGVPGRTRNRRGGFIEGIAGFDPLFFGISPAEARQMDPQQRLVLELVWEALEDAGTVPATLRDARVGVFVGAMWNSYSALTAADPRAITPHSATGGDISIISARVAYTLGLRGPAVTVNTACSSSLVALHQARLAIDAGDCDAALVGGVSLMCGPLESVAMSQFGAMAPDGRCKPFDASADGYVRGEGAGVVLVKPLSRALADGDHVYCAIVGSAVNNDGFSNGLTAPSPQAQRDVLLRACANAGVSPSDVRFVETHGTGTALGDPIEAEALGAVYGARRTPHDPLLLGAVKSNLGHLEAAAGMAGLIKTACVLHRRRVPGNLHFHHPNPRIDFDTLGLTVPVRQRPWPTGDQARAWAGVSSFGFGGTNCHVVMSSTDAGRPEGRPGDRQDRNAVGTHGGGRHHRDGRTAPGPVFVFGGQGAQWPGMGADLLHDPTTARALRRCDRAFEGLLDGSLMERLIDSGAPLTDTRWIQAAVFSVQVALSERWIARGVVPSAVVGQSMGEIAAAHVSGALSLRDAARILAHRTRLIQPARGHGGMALVELDTAAVEAAIGEADAGDLGVAVIGSPGRTVISGGDEALDVFTRHMNEKGVGVFRIDVDYASHSSHMTPFLPLLEAAVADVVTGPAHVEFWSTVTGDRLGGVELSAEYWGRNLRETVRFGPTLTRLAAAKHRVFVDVNPHPISVGDIRACAGDEAVILVSLSRHRSADAVWRESAETLETSTLTPPRAERPPVTGPRLLVLSAKEPEALRQAAERMAAYLTGPAKPSLDDVCHTAARHRQHHEHRLAVLGEDGASIAEVLLQASAARRAGGAWAPETAGTLLIGRASTAAPVTLVLPGAGTDLSDAPELYRTHPEFRRAAHLCRDLLVAENGPDPTGWLTTDGNAVSMSAGTGEFVQGFALSGLLRSWGLPVTAITGEGPGAVAAAATAGALTLPDAIRTLLAMQGAPRCLKDTLVGLRPREADLTYLDPRTLTARPGKALNASYWRHAFTSRITDGAMTDLAASRSDGVVLDLRDDSRGPATGPVEETTQWRLRRLIAGLYVRGVDLDWDLLPFPPGRLTTLPSYPWQHTRYWITDAPPRTPDSAEGQEQRLTTYTADEAAAGFLTRLLSHALGFSSQDMPLNRSPRELGATSLTAMQLRNAVSERFGVDVPMSRWLGDENVRSLAADIDECAHTPTGPPAPDRPPEEDGPLDGPKEIAL
ncbi:beta-ketoacyl synthase N-terminal-like domain-containing protein [Streptomyces sp. NPDC127068]|uniref:type I polyketide synthase n=1 Tax=Streptomyces sp. NPDC127068 TaxID=3347127 RepID=UPI003653F807